MKKEYQIPSNLLLLAIQDGHALCQDSGVNTKAVKLTKGTSRVKATITYADGSSETLTKNVTAK